MQIRAFALFLVGAAAAVLSAQQPSGASSNGRMVRPRFLIHVVPNLEKSVEFYHSGLDLEVIAAPAELTPDRSTLVQKAVASNPSARAKSATLAIPGSNFQLLLIE